MNIKCLAEAAWFAGRMNEARDAARRLGDRPRKITVEIDVSGQSPMRVEINTAEFNCDVLVEAMCAIEAEYRHKLRALGVTGFDGEGPKGPT
jgi:hypothetical protein